MSQNVPSEDIGAIAQILLSLGLIDIEQSQASLLTDDLANVVLKLLLEVPNCSAKLPPKIPENNASRVRLCVEMAEQLKKLGFQRKLGFQSFIYPDAHEAKAILLFLIEQIPRSKLDEKEEISGQKIDTSVGIFDKKVKFALEKALLDPWVPSNPKLHTGKKFGIENISIPWDYLDEDNSKSAEFEFYVDHCFKALQEQVSSEQALFCSAIHLVAKFKAAEKEQQENLFFKVFETLF